MRTIQFTLSLAAAAAFSLGIAGCGTTQSTDPGAGSPQGGSHGENGGHAHGHDHSHPVHGPHGGHLVELGEEEYHAEWLHDDTGKVTVYILDGHVEKEVPIAAESLEVIVKIGEKELAPYTLDAVDPTGDPPKTAKFETVNQELAGGLSGLGEGVEATLKIGIDGKAFVGAFEAHHHH